MNTIFIGNDKISISPQAIEDHQTTRKFVDHRALQVIDKGILPELIHHPLHKWSQ